MSSSKPSLASSFKSLVIPETGKQLRTMLMSDAWEEEFDMEGAITCLIKDDAAIRIKYIRDKGFATYADLCLSNPSPHFQTVAWNKWIDPYTHVTLSERLYPCPSDKEASENLRPALHALWNLAHYTREYDFEYENYIKYGSLKGTRARGEEITKEGLWHYTSQLAKVSPSLAECILLLHRQLAGLAKKDPNYILPLDLSPNNIMIRKDGETGNETIVLSDPYGYADKGPLQKHELHILQVLEEAFGTDDKKHEPPQYNF